MTPMMQQWHACKKTAGAAILFFRMGDFYEVFYDDAVHSSKLLGLTLTKRQEVPMAGVPHHQLDTYVDKLLARGQRVAIAEQMEDPKEAKGLVRREVTRILTPGTSASLVPENRNNFFIAIHQVGKVTGLALLDLSTAEFRVTEFEEATELASELARLQPREVLIPEKFDATEIDAVINTREEWFFNHEIACRALTDHFGVQSLDGFGLQGRVAAINAAGALLKFLQTELCRDLGQVRKVRFYSTAQTMQIDAVTQRNLDLDQLLKVLDHTETAMGGRLLRQWFLRPLLDVEMIRKRQDGVAAFLTHRPAARKVGQALSLVRDLERIVTGRCAPRDLVMLRHSCDQLPILCEALTELLPNLELDPLSDIASRIAAALNDEGTFCEGFCADLDELIILRRDGKDWIARYQAQVREETGIKTMKVGYNRVFGYYLEVSKGQTHLVPDIFQRRQTLANSERYISPALKEYEGKILTAEERIAALEAELLTQLRADVLAQTERILSTARRIAQIDCLAALAEAARIGGYCRPTVDDSDQLLIRDGRHPVIENTSLEFVPNDTELGADRQLLITGPNMAGKSTYIRQVALLTMMAQMGSSVPATSAHFGIVDKLFTRIGAGDDLARGQSTFMVEMSETANILNNATRRSLVILDEIGRGTSTYDGIAIAWAVAEALLEMGPKTLFATHYGELTELEGVTNYHAAVREVEGRVIFLHKIEPGVGDRSYGIHCAQLAGMPPQVVARAKEIFARLEHV